MRRIIALATVVLVMLGTFSNWAQANLFQLFILEARTDLELLADEVLDEGVRPDNWTFNTDLESETVVVDLWFDNEQLADELYGVGERPNEWFGATSTDPELIARNIRHDLELMADTVFDPMVRPEGWNGALPIYRCDRTIQNVVRLLDTIYNTRPQTPASVVDYCRALKTEVANELIPVVFQTIAGSDETLSDLVLALRGDVERLANEELGVNNRPANWIGNVEPGSPTMAADSAADIERLADIIIGVETRPEEWNMFSSTSEALVYRNLRLNLELLADIRGGEGNRPNGWQGMDPLEQCNLLEQMLVLMLQINFDFVIDEGLMTQVKFCEIITFTANSVAENPPRLDEREEEDRRYTAEAEYAFAYMDTAALEYMGIMPAGTEFRAWYRNFNESTMMFVSGEDFAVYIDQRWTTLDADLFETLPTLEGVIPLAFCDADWCNGPGPTPTPTGSGPLELLLAANTPQAPVDPGNVPNEGGGAKAQVSWNHVRVTYLLDRPEVGTAQVALEICAEPQQIACEPVIRVFDNTLGTEKPVISQFNGLNVYEFRYGFNQNVVVEGATRVAPDLWISDPALR